MSRIKDNGNIAKTVEKMTGQKPVIVAVGDEINYIMPSMQKLYNLLQPAMTTIENNNLIYFNSNEMMSDNAYPIQLIDYYHNASSTFSNFINLRRNMLIGGGLQPVDNSSGNTATIAFLNKPNEFGQSIQDLWSLWCFDYALFESYFAELLYNPSDGTINSVIHHSPDTVRAVANANPNLPYVNEWQLSRNWGTTNKRGRYVQTALQGISISNFNLDTWATDGARQLINCKRYSAGNEVYTVPSFNAILAYVELDAQLATYALNSVTKGFAPQSIVVLSGNPDKKTKDEFVNKFKMKYTGADAERVLFIWSVDDATKPVIMPFQNADITPMLELLDKICAQKIASGMGGNLELAGIQSTGGQSLQADANKIAVSYNFYYMVHVLPMQKQMVETIKDRKSVV